MCHQKMNAVVQRDVGRRLHGRWGQRPEPLHGGYCVAQSPVVIVKKTQPLVFRLMCRVAGDNLQILPLPPLK